MGFYNAEISAGSLMLQESRRLARLLTEHPTEAQWMQAIKVVWAINAPFDNKDKLKDCG